MKTIKFAQGHQPRGHYPRDPGAGGRYPSGPRPQTQRAGLSARDWENTSSLAQKPLNLVGNTFRGISTTAKGLANTAAGTVGQVIGGVGIPFATGFGYTTDAMGLTDRAGPRNYDGSRAFYDTMRDATAYGVMDTFGGAADTLSGGWYDYDGSATNYKPTAVDHMRRQHVQQMQGPSAQPGDLFPLSQNAAVNSYAGLNATADVAAEWAAGGAASKGLGALRAARGASAATAAAPAAAAPTVAQRVGQTAAGGAGVGIAAVDATERARLTTEGNSGATPAYITNVFPDADGEQAAQIAQAGQQLSSLPDSQKQTAAEALADPESPAAQELATRGQQNYVDEHMDTAPSDPQQFGVFMNTMLNQFSAMPMEAKIGMGLGLAGGVVSLMQALNGGGIGSFLLGALGLGGAGALAAGHGLFGGDAQRFVQNTGQSAGANALSLGAKLGLPLPEQTDLSALLADDPIAAGKAQGDKELGFFSSSEELDAAVAAAEAKKKQLAQLLRDVPTWAQPTVLQYMDPKNIKTVEDAERALAGAQTAYEQLTNPESDVNAELNRARWASQFRAYDPRTWWWAPTPDTEEPAADEEKNSSHRLLARALNKYAFNAVDAKELHDLKHEQRKKYDLDNARRLNELSMRKQQQSSSQRSFCAPQTAAPAIRSISITVLRKAARCWAGYEPVPGAKPYSRGSCRPVGSKKTQKEMKKT